MKRDAPPWAFRLAVEVCEAAGVPVPQIIWRRNRADNLTSGRGSLARGVRITAGTSYKDQKLVLLHELAHWLRQHEPDGLGTSHDARFWDIAFGLYKRYRLGQYGIKREQGYKMGAIAAAYRAGIISRRDAEHRSALYREAARR